MAFRSHCNQDLAIRYWRTSTGQEVDFLLNDREVGIEVKGSARVPDVVLRPLTILADDGPLRRRIVVCLEREPREVRDRRGRIAILPVHGFLHERGAGGLPLGASGARRAWPLLQALRLTGTAKSIGLPERLE